MSSGDWIKRQVVKIQVLKTGTWLPRALQAQLNLNTSLRWPLQINLLFNELEGSTSTAKMGYITSFNPDEYKLMNRSTWIAFAA
jgi:hypothetical protein